MARPSDQLKPITVQNLATTQRDDVRKAPKESLCVEHQSNHGLLDLAAPGFGGMR